MNRHEAIGLDGLPFLLGRSWIVSYISIAYTHISVHATAFVPYRQLHGLFLAVLIHTLLFFTIYDCAFRVGRVAALQMNIASARTRLSHDLNFSEHAE